MTHGLNFVVMVRCFPCCLFVGPESNFWVLFFLLVLCRRDGNFYVVVMWVGGCARAHLA